MNAVELKALLAEVEDATASSLSRADAGLLISSRPGQGWRIYVYFADPDVYDECGDYTTRLHVSHSSALGADITIRGNADEEPEELAAELLRFVEMPVAV